MASPENRSDKDPFSIMVATDLGLEEYRFGFVEPDEHGIPTSISPDTEYAILNAEQSKQYWTNPSTRVERQDAARYPGAFALHFAMEAGEAAEEASVVLSQNRISHIASIEQAVRAGE